ncbi:MAG: flagellar hook basal-body protein [Mariprofundaceae bacterium]
MDRGFFVSGVAGNMTSHRLNSIAHNLANANTTGYMLDRTGFSTMLANVDSANKDASTLPAAYMTMDKQYINSDKGIIRQTGNDLDFAIRGNGFFQVETDDGQKAYTRGGNFHLGADGILLTEGNMPVLNDSGSEINLPPGRVTASESGALKVNEQEVAQLGLFKIDSLQQAQKISGSVVTIDESLVSPADKDISLHQGMLEGSNVNSVLMMVEMMQNTRSNQSMMKVLEQYNQQEGLISEKVGRVPG